MRRILSIAIFLAVAVPTALAVARIVGGPGAPDDCAGDECDANMAPGLAFLFLGVPVGVVLGLIAVMLLRRLARTRRTS